MSSYATRNHAFAPAQTWVLEGDALQIQEANQPPQKMPLRDITMVRLEFAPTRFETNRYRCEVSTRDGRRREFFSRTFEAAFNFRETKREYVPFVRDLHTALVRANPGCRYWAGASPARFWFGVACFGFAGLVVLGALVFFWSVGLHYLSLLKGVLILVFIPIAVLWLRRNRPRAYAPAAIPPAVLPRVD